ncbi:MAG TPA: hypothetical protein VHV10_06555 [Ktedonobacteraceae bacterium]|nr:hypothetical protein [Ktedonobacteraceae bacterium]
MVALPHINTQAVSSEVIDRLCQNVPSCIKTHRQYVVWRYQEDEKGKLKKPPFNPRNGHAARTDDPTTWGTFDQALARYAKGGYDGIGYVCNGDIAGGDLDHCRDLQTGKIEPWAQEIIDRMHPYAYFEISPSETGLRFLMLADLPFNYKKAGPFELSSRSCYVTITGNHLEGTPIDLPSGPEVQNALDSILSEHFPTTPKVNTVGGGRTGVHEPQPIYSRTRSDNEVIEKASGAKNGWRFDKLFSGSAQGHKSRSEAHLALCSMLTYWTNGDAVQMDRLFRQSGFFIEEDTVQKWDERHYADGRTYGQGVIDKALQTSQAYGLPKPHRQERSIPHVAPAAPRVTIEEHIEKLAKICRDIQSQARAHIKSGDASVLVVAAPPGVGKSRALAAIGTPTTQPTADGQHDVAWIAQRHDMVDSIADLLYYRHIQPCTDQNCHEHSLHLHLGQKGYNTMSIHSKHLAGCDYADQHKQEGSAVYQQAHIRSSYPAKHEAIVLDELDPSTWLPEREVTVEKLHAALVQYSAESTADRLLRTLQGILTDKAQEGKAIYGKDIFDALDRAAHGQLTNWLGELDQDARNRDPHPFVELDPYDPEVENRVQSLTPVLMPHLLRALMAELVKWQRGQDWNSCLRIGPATYGPGYALFVTEPLMFTPGKDGTLPPAILSDATVDEEIHGLIFGRKLKIERAPADPAPGTRHIAIRSGKRYGKTSLATRRKDGKPNRDLQRAIAEVRYELNKLDPSGEQIRSGKVGIISFQGCVNEIGEALGIPEERRGHYWGIRGSNHLEDCSILLLVGTPTLRPDELLRQARALYRDDPDPIKETSPEDYKSTGKHTDPRLQHFAEYTINAELTQAAHRNRPVRRENKTIVSFCLGDIDFLPATETIIELPFLTPEGEDSRETRRNDQEARLEKAYADLTKDGNKPTQDELRKAAKVDKARAAEWMRERKEDTPPPVFTHESESIHHTIENISYSKTNTSESEPSENAPPPNLDDLPDEARSLYVEAVGCGTLDHFSKERHTDLLRLLSFPADTYTYPYILMWLKHRIAKKMEAS